MIPGLVSSPELSYRVPFTTETSDEQLVGSFYSVLSPCLGCLWAPYFANPLAEGIPYVDDKK